jgi:tetratricopeptide (TPR) repeat protein
MQPRISIITPWLDRPQFIEDYERATNEPGFQVIVVDNGSGSGNAIALQAMIERLRGIYIRNEQNRWFSGANNQGLARASGEIVLFLNNDISAQQGWLARLVADVGEGGLYGPSLAVAQVQAKSLEYLEGWCIAGRRSVWQRLGGWDEKAYAMPYFEDLDLSLRAEAMGIRLTQTQWPVFHKKNGTCVDVPGVPLAFEHNRRIFERKLAGEAIDEATLVAAEKPTLESAAALLREKRLAEAESALAKLVELEPRVAEAWTLYSQALYLSGRSEAAIAAMRRAVELAPGSSQSYNGLGVLLARLGMHDPAVEALQQAALLAPDAADVYNNLSRSLAQLQRFSESSQAASKAIELAPASAAAHINLSIALKGIGKPQESLNAAQRACLLDPASALAVATLAQSLHALGRNNEALAAIDEALRRTPDNATFQRIRSSIVNLAKSEERKK